MNANQYRGLAFIPKTYTDPLRRWIACPYCSWLASRFRRGPGANALGAADSLRAELYRHIKQQHPEAIEQPEKDGGDA